MSKNNKNIDRIFKRQLGNYSQKAPNDVWGNIEQAINTKKVTNKFSIYKIAAAIAALTIIGSGLFYLTNNVNSIDTTPVLAENNKKEEASESKDERVSKLLEEVKDDEAVNINTEIVGEELNPNIIVEPTNSDLSEEFIAKVEMKTENNSYEKLSQKQILITSRNNKLEIIDKREQQIKSYLNTFPDFYNSYAFTEAIEIENSNKNKWLVGGEFSPLYSYRNITETSGVYDKDFYNSSESPVMTYTGGLNLQYKAAGRLTIQAGIYYTSMGQSIDYMGVYANSAYNMVEADYKDRFLNSYTIENSSGELSFNSSHVIVDEKLVRVNNLSDSKGIADLSSPIFSDLNAEIEQNFQYIEVPVILRYTLIDKNIDFNIIGGFGANFLVGNNVFLSYAGNKEVIGETYGVSPVSYNGTIGIGIDYPLMKRINIRVEPSIKYYLNELNSNSPIESHPYSVGIYTGINYSF